MSPDVSDGLPTPPSTPFEAVLFDCDGVLVDSEPITNEVLRVMLGDLGWHLEPEESMRRFIGVAVADQADLIEQHTGVRIDDAWIAEFRRRRSEQLAVRVQAVDGVAEVLAAVADAYGERIACASGADRPKVQLQLDTTGLARWFGDRLFSGLELPRTKPAPDVYLQAAQVLGVDPRRCAVVEDSPAGVRAGVAAGATVFGYCPGGPASSTPEALRALGASTTFSAMHELPALLGVARG
ncbi:haloacid dehalogenase superfamily, subfamily IA, variant 3 with third motif having DD or ED [Quadrisphaera granulorum]|uniref:HAD superfamily hydrolase (TIGR01509 family) n=1 Tax=Quadrisphaera granulorum TaxID=317664 RepID=A0A316A8H8_9ACTN|nr:HAD family phosphatase [Quadrisphaera granulorum]PWJ53134.1 HAD superfamily hydrolase (TIGR01509 family) [Quadrisphaera granulorum]SZE97066.1 haloacid dehalogenase superfamily, subfamily IA, variant 3 with third motif having DD or ED [Quadrisphaera granulorum]